MKATLAVILCGITWSSGAQPLSGTPPTTSPSNSSTPADAPGAVNNSNQPTGPTTQAASSQAPDTTGASDAEDLRQLIGVRAPGLAPVALPKLPAMSLRGFVETTDGRSFALLEVVDLNRIFVVKENTEIPITVQGRISPINQSELVGLGQSANPSAKPDEANAQSQIILKIIKVSDEGVIVQAGLNNQTIVIR